MADKRLARLEAINQKAPRFGSLSHLESVSFGANLKLERFRMANGLEILTCEDHSAPVVSYHTWFRVGSRHEREGKTGLAHLFEHLMFNEVEGRQSGEFDRKLEEAGAESNASTWLDWTQYNVSVPKDPCCASCSMSKVCAPPPTSLRKYSARNARSMNTLPKNV